MPLKTDSDGNPFWEFQYLKGIKLFGGQALGFKISIGTGLWYVDNSFDHIIYRSLIGLFLVDKDGLRGIQLTFFMIALIFCWTQGPGSNQSDRNSTNQQP